VRNLTCDQTQQKHCKRACVFHCIGHTALKRFKDIVAIREVIVFLAVIAMLSTISLCVIAALVANFQVM